MSVFYFYLNDIFGNRLPFAASYLYVIQNDGMFQMTLDRANREMCRVCLEWIFHLNGMNQTEQKKIATKNHIPQTTAHFLIECK